MPRSVRYFILSLSLAFWGACQSSPVLYVPQFKSFEINKITEHGIQNLDVNPIVGKDWPEVDYDDVAPIKFKSSNLRIAVIGDTGCRLKEDQGGASYQNCSESGEWPYPELVKNLVKEKYDFVVHTGDYHYREQCGDRELCPGYSRSIGYTWAAWWDDFYGPSQDLFKKSPILLIRGNHEDCKRAHSGWAPLSVFNKQFDEKCDEVEPYQWIEIGDLVFINFDDSSFEDRKESKAGELKKYEVQFKVLAERIRKLKDRKEIWFLSHKPVHAYIPDKGDHLIPKSIQPYLKEVLERSGLLKEVDYFLSGHVHNQQMVLHKERLQQIIVGHSGTVLDPFGKKLMNDKLITSTATAKSWGYALFERRGFKRWKFIYKSLQGKTEMECKVRDRRVKCSNF